MSVLLASWNTCSRRRSVEISLAYHTVFVLLEKRQALKGLVLHQAKPSSHTTVHTFSSTHACVATRSVINFDIAGHGQTKFSLIGPSYGLLRQCHSILGQPQTWSGHPSTSPISHQQWKYRHSCDALELEVVGDPPLTEASG